jgi:hypothetical protein
MSESNLPSIIKQEIRRLGEAKKQIDEKIKRLERTLEAYGTEKLDHLGGGSTRGGIDIRPTIERIFNENGNSPLKKSEIVSKVKEMNPDIPTETIQSKMVQAVRTILEKSGEYGKYRLRETFLKSS